MQINEITSRILGAAYRIHSALGPGLLETAYEVCLEHELLRSGLRVRRQVQVPVRYDDITLDVGYRWTCL
jgi:GxxExxY protein